MLKTELTLFYNVENRINIVVQYIENRINTVVQCWKENYNCFTMLKIEINRINTV